MAFILDLCAQLICAFVFENAKSRVSHDTAHADTGVVDLPALRPTSSILTAMFGSFFASSNSINIFVGPTLLLYHQWDVSFTPLLDIFCCHFLKLAEIGQLGSSFDSWVSTFHNFSCL